MRKTVWSRLLALLLVLSMFATPVSAAGKPGSKNPKPGTSTSAAKEDKKAEKEDKKNNKEDKKNNKDEKPSKPSKPSKPGKDEPVVEETEPVVEETEPVVDETVAVEEELTLIEGASNVDNGTLLRSSTFSLRSARVGEVVPVYFPVTMFDYDSRINAATKQLDTGSDSRFEGLYFNDGSPGSETLTSPLEIPEGQYLIQNIRANSNGVGSWLQAHSSNKIYGVTKADATLWTLSIEDGSYYLSCEINGTTHYMVVGTNGDNDGYTTTKTPIEIVSFDGGDNSGGVQLKQGNYYLCQWGGVDVLDYGGYHVNNDGGNGMRFYAVNTHEALTWEQVQKGTYYAEPACINKVTVTSQDPTTYEPIEITYSTNTANVNDLNKKYTDGTYYYYYEQHDTYYQIQEFTINQISFISELNVYCGIGEDGRGLNFSQNSDFTIYKKSGGEIVYTLSAGNTTLATMTGTDTTQPVGISLYTSGGNVTAPMSVTKTYADWNRWDKASGDNANGDLIYTGLVQNTLVDDQIVFNVPEGGIFNDDASVKAIYEYVGLPFVLNSETGVYTFDSDANGAYFEGTPTSGTGPADNEMHKLHFAAGAPQPMPTNLSVGDGSTNAFFPFNNQSSYVTSDVNYHFGMRADIPFSLTPNGRIKSTDDTSAPISFTFSGDDDVWVFIDGHLVVDLGGIHNRLDVTIDFAANTVTYSEENAQDQNNETGSYNDSTFATVQKLFAGNESTGSGTGLINMSREAFALDQDHEMQVFYLERGEGTSNGRIEFNLPMTDTVIVTKDATKSWSQAAEDADLKADPNAVDPGVEDLTSTEQAAVDNINFGFTLYKKTADDAGFAPVANTNFYLVGKGVTDVTINQTDANGHFYLKNGQSAKFITDIPTAGITYYVVEDQVPAGFVSPDFNYAGKAVYDYTYTGYNDGVNESGTAPAQDASEIPEQIIPMPEEDADGTLTWAENKSFEVTVKGSVEAQDSIEFICSNYLDAELPNPTALAYEDIIVIDYGLPVNIDPLANDVFRGESIEIVYVGGEDVELTTTTNADGIVSATWTEDSTLNYGTVEPHDVTYAAASGDQEAVRDTMTYTLNKQLTEVEVLSYIIKVNGEEEHEATGVMREQYSYALAKVYIVPATTMYYEEDFPDEEGFSNLVSFKGSGWTGPVTTEGASDYQEPGVVGMGYSTYGSDVAYLSDSFDSNGTSYHGDTTNGAIQFSYTFTGTGTSIFARTSATTGYMQVKLYQGENTSGELVNITYRDTYYKDENDLDDDSDGTLYNIPVYTEESLDYGTYTVVATVAKAGTKTAGNDNGSGNDFYLDGIRIMEPLNESANKAMTEKALGAYATDGEANMESVTLRYKLIGDAEEGVNDWGFVVFTDVEGAVDNVEDYITIGPKEEVYLLPGQSVTFAVEYWHQDGYLMHLGMKAPFGTGTAQVGNNTFNLENATDCYYNITGMHTGVLTKYEQLVENDRLVYVDQNGNRIFEDAEGYLFDADGNEVTDEELELTPVDDTNKPYYVATYTIKAVDKIVSLTKLKVTGNYRFHVNRDVDIEINGSEGSGADGEGH